MPGVRDPHPPVERRVRGTGIPHDPARQRLHPRRGAPPPPAVDRRDARPGARVVSPRPSSPIRERQPAADRGIGLLIIFTAGVLAMVGLITLTAIIGRWWILGPVMAFDFVVTAAVLAIIARLLDD
jgi:hypothetical protein